MEDIRFFGKPDFKIENPGFVSVLRNKDFTFEYKNGKKWHSFIYVEKGCLEYFFKPSKKYITVNKGEMLFMPKKLPYIAKYLTDNTLLKIFTFDIHTTQLPDNFKTPFVSSSKSYHDIFSACHRQSTRNAFFLFSKIYELFYTLQANDLFTPEISTKIMPAINEINNNYHQNKKISYYADLCMMSESNFRKLFREQTGKSPIEYRNLLRLAEVKNLLNSGEYTVAEAAYKAGFNNMSFFYELYNSKKQPF